jgi:hypothetical protein
MNKAYDPDLIHSAQKLASAMGLETHTGVYCCVGGPNYETVAELRMWKLLGVDAVGMSTVSDLNIFEIPIIFENFPSKGSRSHHSSSLRHESLCIFSYHQQM